MNQFDTPKVPHRASHWQLQTVAGDYWTVKEDGEDFPVIICDDEIVEEFFEFKKRPVSARQADGNWNSKYKLGRALASCREFPVFFLGTTQCSWIPGHLLESFNPRLAGPILESTAETNVNPVLTSAWEAALDWERDLDFWKNKLYRLRDEKQRKQSPKIPHPCSLLQMRKWNEFSGMRYTLQSTSRTKRIFDDREDDEDEASPTSKVKIGQAPECSNLHIQQEARTRESDNQGFGLAITHPKQDPQNASLAYLDNLYDVSASSRSSLGRNKRYKKDQSSQVASQPRTPNRHDRDASHSVIPHEALDTHSDAKLEETTQNIRSDTQAPYGLTNLLGFVDDFFRNGGPEVREWLIEFISKHFFEFMRSDGICFADKLKQNPTLSSAVFKKMHELTIDEVNGSEF